MRKAGVFLIFILVFLGLTSILHTGVAQPQIPGGDGIMNATDDLQNAIDEKRWEYLGEEWKKILLNNKAIEIFDNAMRSINFVFVFLFAEDYDLSITLVFAILLGSVLISMGIYSFLLNITSIEEWFTSSSFFSTLLPGAWLFNIILIIMGILVLIKRIALRMTH